MLITDSNGNHAVFTPQNLAETVNHGDLVFLELRPNPGNQGFDDFVLAGNDGFLVNRCPRRTNAVFVTMLGVVENLGAVQQGFGRHAAFIQTDTTEGPFFDDERFHTGVTGTFGCKITGRAAAQDDEIEHGFFLHLITARAVRSFPAPASCLAGSALPVRRQWHGGHR